MLSPSRSSSAAGAKAADERWHASVDNTSSEALSVPVFSALPDSAKGTALPVAKSTIDLSLSLSLSLEEF
jgi:hypothetical protein